MTSPSCPHCEGSSGLAPLASLTQLVPNWMGAPWDRQLITRDRFPKQQHHLQPWPPHSAPRLPQQQEQECALSDKPCISTEHAPSIITHQRSARAPPSSQSCCHRGLSLSPLQQLKAELPWTEEAGAALRLSGARPWRGAQSPVFEWLEASSGPSKC